MAIKPGDRVIRIDPDDPRDSGPMVVQSLEMRPNGNVIVEMLPVNAEPGLIGVYTNQKRVRKIS